MGQAFSPLPLGPDALGRIYGPLIDIVAQQFAKEPDWEGQGAPFSRPGSYPYFEISHKFHAALAHSGAVQTGGQYHRTFSPANAHHGEPFQKCSFPFSKGSVMPQYMWETSQDRKSICLITFLSSWALPIPPRNIGHAEQNTGWNKTLQGAYPPTLGRTSAPFSVCCRHLGTPILRLFVVYWPHSFHTRKKGSF